MLATNSDKLRALVKGDTMMAIAIEHTVSRFMLGTTSRRGEVVDAPKAATLVA